MIGRELARLVLAVGVFFLVVPGLVLLTQEPGSAGFVVTVFTLAIGLILLLLALVLLRLTDRHADRSPPSR